MHALAEHSQVVRVAVDAKWSILEGIMKELEARGVGPGELTRAETDKQRRAVLEYSLAMAHLRRQEADAAFVARRYQVDGLLDNPPGLGRRKGGKGNGEEGPEARLPVTSGAGASDVGRTPGLGGSGAIGSCGAVALLERTPGARAREGPADT